MQNKKKILDFSSTITLVITVVLFIAAAFIHGFGHEMLLEAGVFLISVKLVLSASKNEISLKAFHDRLDEIEKKIDQLKR